jgi:hypothetical protein
MTARPATSTHPSAFLGDGLRDALDTTSHM